MLSTITLLMLHSTAPFLSSSPLSTLGPMCVTDRQRQTQDRQTETDRHTHYCTDNRKYAIFIRVWLVLLNICTFSFAWFSCVWEFSLPIIR